jgi:hypothetical protein
MTQQRGFTKKFAEEAVRLVQTSGRTQREIAGDLGLAYRHWSGGSGGAGIGTLSTRLSRGGARHRGVGRRYSAIVWRRARLGANEWRSFGGGSGS